MQCVAPTWSRSRRPTISASRRWRALIRSRSCSIVTRRYNAPLSILMIDVDEFKDVNDTFGHLAGDQVLVEVALLLARTARSVDSVARYGGDEFVIAVPETGEVGAIAFAERLRDKIQAHEFDIGKGDPLRLTVSIGVADFPEPKVETAEDLLDCADRALYRAKAGGRNLV